MVETGILLAVGRQLAGGKRQVVGLQDADDLLVGDAGLGHLGRVEGDEDLRLETAGQVGAGDAVKASDLRAGSRRWRSRAASSSPSALVAAMEAMITGDALMLSA